MKNSSLPSRIRPCKYCGKIPYVAEHFLGEHPLTCDKDGTWVAHDTVNGQTDKHEIVCKNCDIHISAGNDLASIVERWNDECGMPDNNPDGIALIDYVTIISEEDCRNIPIEIVQLRYKGDPCYRILMPKAELLTMLQAFKNPRLWWSKNYQVHFMSNKIKIDVFGVVDMDVAFDDWGRPIKNN